jgi:hypothetical protein
VRFDNTEVPGLRKTIGYIDIINITPQELADLISQKLGTELRTNYFPPVPDRLYERLELDEEELQSLIYSQSYGIFDVLKRMTDEERKVIFLMFLHGCLADMPDNIHIDIDLLRRLSGFPVSKLKRLLGGIRSLGFFCSVTESEEEHEQHLGHTRLFVLKWHLMSSDIGGEITFLANEIIRGAIDGLCINHGMEVLERLDFSQLASATTVEDIHEKA